MTKNIFLFMVVFAGTQPFLFSQTNDTITEREVIRVMHYLAADSLRGRGNGKPELLKAGLFIGNEFRKNKLQPLPGLPGYFLPFRPFGGSKAIAADSLFWNGFAVPSWQFIYFHTDPGNYQEKHLPDFRVIKIDTFFTDDILRQFSDDTSSLLLWTDKKQPDGENFFPERLKTPSGEMKRNVLLVYTENAPELLILKANASWYSKVQYNIAGIIPGKSKPGELIIFSAHYDHVGVDPFQKDSILNGANDDASGTTALLLLVHYFSKRNDNARTIIFCAFSGEELGLLGSKNFVGMIDPQKIIAGINIEMIGVPQFGKNKVFITGEKYSSLPQIIGKGLKKSGIKVLSDPDETRRLFQRSDNYSFVLKGVPFHTIMGSDDNDPCYHKPCDEVKRVDIANMTHIIRAIALSAQSLIDEKDTPSRVNIYSLQ
jgi:hypothetical protein